MTEYETDALNAEVARVVSKGYRIESRTDRQVVLVRRKPFSWWLHIPLVIVTGGVWLLVAIPLVLRRPQRITLSLDGAGGVSRVR